MESETLAQGSGVALEQIPTAEQDTIENVKTNTLIFYAKNSRTHSDIQVQQIAGSIREFGFLNPVLIDGENSIIAGHGRVMAASILKMETVPCRRITHLTDAQRRAYVIADNRIALSSGWDSELLANELSDLHADDFDMALLGFDPNELSVLLGLGDDADPELPQLTETSSHTVVVRYSDEDSLVFCRWLGVDLVPEQMGKLIREKILASAGD
jgi:ParB-like chromosome segregation protein Spo0J